MRDSHYVVDPALVAEAILLRRAMRRLVPDTRFRNDTSHEEVRSFRPSRQARSFRPCSVSRMRRGLAAGH